MFFSEDIFFSRESFILQNEMRFPDIRHQKAFRCRLVAIAGILLLLGGAGMLLGSYVEWAVIALVLFFVPVTLKMHAFWKDTDPQARAMNMTQFLKNSALLGASLMILSIPTPWMYSIF
mgnify:CR=1 FL=1